jgi:tetratricopeptide (TPR) repeat protein
MHRTLLAAALLLAALVPAAAAGQDGGTQEEEAFFPFFLSPDRGACGPPGSLDMPVHPDPRVQALVERARSLERAGRRRQAARAYHVAYLRSAGSDAAPYLLLRYCCLDEGAEGSTGCLRRVLEEHPRFTRRDEVLFELGRRLYLTGRPEQALETLARVDSGAGSPQVAAAARALSGVIVREQGDAGRALRELAAAIDLLAGWSAGETGSDEGAAQDGGPEQPGGLFSRLYLEAARCMEAGDPRLRPLLLGVAGTAPEPLVRAEALFMLGELRLEEGERADAAGAFRLLVDSHPASPFTPAAGRALAELGEVEPGQPRLLREPGLLDGSFPVLGPAVPGSGGEAPGRFTVQVGSFERRENAEALAGRLKAGGFPAFVTEAAVEGRVYYRVRVGGYASREDARRELGVLEDAGFRGFVVTGG